jgi:hypothetical protein
MIRHLFQDWQRATGIALMVMGIAVMAVWFRSEFFRDRITCDAGNGRQVSFESCYGTLAWVSVLHDKPALTWSSFRHESYADVLDTVTLFVHTSDGDERRWSIPHWYLALPLSLISTFIILRRFSRNHRTTSLAD